jgi:hypothetical protein
MIAIGVTGHRFLAEVDRLTIGIDQALSRIDERYPGEAWSVISSLAEGADRLVVERVLARHPSARLVAVLPLPEADYQADFASVESIKDFKRLLSLASETLFLPSAPTREEAYWAGGDYVLAHASVLIALWDGQGAQGRGGTGEMVTLARARGLPLAWVRCGNRKPGTNEGVSLGEEQGEVSFEGF